jgi:hypothetical protein
MELVFIVRDQEVEGSNPFAPTNSLPDTNIFADRLVSDQEVEREIPLPRPFYLPLSYGLRVRLPGALQHVKLVRLVQQLVQRSVAALWEQKA